MMIPTAAQHDAPMSEDTSERIDLLKQMDAEIARRAGGGRPLMLSLFTSELEMLVAAMRAPAVDVEGWQLVPKQISPEMEDAFFRAHARAMTIFATTSEWWEAVLAAAPLPPAPKGDGR